MFILGNAPSLKQYNLSRIKAATFGCNKIYKMEDFAPTFYTCADIRMFESHTKEIHDYLKKNLTTLGFFPDIHPNGNNIKKLCNFHGDNVSYFPNLQWGGHCVDGTSFGIHANVVHLMLQLSYVIGFRQFYLLGVDFSYPKDFINQPQHFYEEDAVGNYSGDQTTAMDGIMALVQTMTDAQVVNCNKQSKLVTQHGMPYVSFEDALRGQ